MNFNKSTISYNVGVCIPIESRAVYTKIQSRQSILKSKVKVLEKIYFDANELYFSGSSVHINQDEYWESIKNLKKSINLLKKKIDDNDL